MASQAGVAQWGILGCARIAQRALIPALKLSNIATLYGVASRNYEKATEWCASYQAEEAYGSYRELLSDPAIHVVYNPLPNGLHAEWSIRAMESGKHVLCEKPLARSAAEAKTMMDAAAANGVSLVEAFMYRFHPRTAQLKQFIDEGKVGKPLIMRSAFSFGLGRDDDHRWLPEHGGGALMDVGCYCVSLARYLLGKPVQASAVMKFRPETVGSDFPVDIATAGVVTFESGAWLQFSSRFDVKEPQFAEIIGDGGRLRADSPFLPPTGRITVHHDDAEVESPQDHQYRAQVDAVSRLALASTADEKAAAAAELAKAKDEPTDAVENMAVLDALRQSAVEGRPVDVAMPAAAN